MMGVDLMVSVYHPDFILVLKSSTSPRMNVDFRGFWSRRLRAVSSKGPAYTAADFQCLEHLAHSEHSKFC